MAQIQETCTLGNNDNDWKQKVGLTKMIEESIEVAKNLNPNKIGYIDAEKCILVFWTNELEFQMGFKPKRIDTTISLKLRPKEGTDQDRKTQLFLTKNWGIVDEVLKYNKHIPSRMRAEHECLIGATEQDINSNT